MFKFLINNKYEVLIDDEDKDRVMEYNWCLAGHGYVRCTSRKLNNIKLHRFIMNPPIGVEVDHINHDRLDNRKSELRLCTHQQNSFNERLSKNNTSGFKGVSWRKDTNNWVAYIHYNRRKLHLGNFKVKQEAVKARLDKEQELFGEFGGINVET